MAHVIGVDIGTQSTKAVLVDAAGCIVAQAARGYHVETPQALWAEQWPEVWLDAVEQCVAEVVRRAALDPASISGLCVGSLYGGSGVPVDAEGRPTHPCLIWMDRRAEDEVAWVRRTVDLERLYDITGNGVDSYYGYTKMLWLREQRPDA
ncbi:MAG: FGGY family carbohydrate kinase, partial [Caldimonas sp.]